MKIISYFFFRPRKLRMLDKSFLFGAIAAVGLASSAFALSSQVDAQTPTEIRNYAKSVLAMEPERRQAFEEIKKLIGGREIPQIVCSDSNSLSSLPNKARDIAVNYCNRSQKIVEQNGLSIDNFNKITRDLQSNEKLKAEIYNTLLNLQKNP
ncbi:DUF4168 domain-containing protein [Scytonema hofmannii FACHB-248]|uniref:DUF4168 domain-containing protein n=2 Tax=Cyanophyceae TaxID=3028117 RepID=A0ABR8GRX7_9CYAN|nr:DUF4168 domain-containing protein [Scytonema hofmannii FACHB-248]